MSRRKSKPKVVVIGPLGAVGGMATSMRLQLSSSLVRDCKLIPFDNSKRTPPDRSLWQGIGSQLGLACELMRLLGQHRPDLVHIHTCSGPTFYRSMLDLLLSKLYGVQVILHIRGGRFSEFLQGLSSMPKALVRWALVSADRVIVLSPTWAGRIGEFDSRICLSVITNGVVLPKHPRRRRETAKIKIVFAGTTKKSKGVDDLIEAISKLPKSTHSGLEVHVIGPDPENRIDELSVHVEKLGLDEIVVLRGTLSPDEVGHELSRASIFVLPSHAEALPNALLEAMACGLPSVVSEVGAIGEVINDGVEGFLIRPGDVEQLSAHLKKLIGDGALRQRMGRAARNRARAEFSQEKVTSLLGALYLEMLTAAGAGR